MSLDGDEGLWVASSAPFINQERSALNSTIRDAFHNQIVDLEPPQQVDLIHMVVRIWQCFYCQPDNRSADQVTIKPKKLVKAPEKDHRKGFNPMIGSSNGCPDVQYKISEVGGWSWTTNLLSYHETWREMLEVNPVYIRALRQAFIELNSAKWGYITQKGAVHVQTLCRQYIYSLFTDSLKEQWIH